MRHIKRTSTLANIGCKHLNIGYELGTAMHPTKIP